MGHLRIFSLCIFIALFVFAAADDEEDVDSEEVAAAQLAWMNQQAALANQQGAGAPANQWGGNQWGGNQWNAQPQNNYPSSSDPEEAEEPEDSDYPYGQPGAIGGEQSDPEEPEEPEEPENESPYYGSSWSTGGVPAGIGAGAGAIGIGEEEDLSEEEMAAIGNMGGMGGAQVMPGADSDMSSEEEIDMGAGGGIGGGGAIGNTMGPTFFPGSTLPPAIQTNTFRPTTQRTPEPIRGDGAAIETGIETGMEGGAAAFENPNANVAEAAPPAPQKMSKKQVAAISTGSAAAGVVGVAAVGVGVAFKAGLIGGGGGGAAAATGAAAV